MSFETEHWSSPNGCHEDCPACAAEEAAETGYTMPDKTAMFRLLWEMAYSGRRRFTEKLDDARILLNGNTNEQPEQPPL